MTYTSTTHSDSGQGNHSCTTNASDTSSANAGNDAAGGTRKGQNSPNSRSSTGYRRPRSSRVRCSTTKATGNSNHRQRTNVVCGNGRRNSEASSKGTHTSGANNPEGRRRRRSKQAVLAPAPVLTSWPPGRRAPQARHGPSACGFGQVRARVPRCTAHRVPVAGVTQTLLLRIGAVSAEPRLVAFVTTSPTLGLLLRRGFRPSVAP